MSPGTSSALGTVTSSPSRSTVEWARVMTDSAATAFSARASWMRPSAAFSRMIARITIASIGSPSAPSMTHATIEMTTAASSSTMSGSVNWARMRRHSGLRLVLRNSFGPDRGEAASGLAARQTPVGIDPEHSGDGDGIGAHRVGKAGQVDCRVREVRHALILEWPIRSRKVRNTPEGYVVPSGEREDDHGYEARYQRHARTRATPGTTPTPGTTSTTHEHGHDMQPGTKHAEHDVHAGHDMQPGHDMHAEHAGHDMHAGHDTHAEVTTCTPSTQARRPRRSRQTRRARHARRARRARRPWRSRRPVPPAVLDHARHRDPDRPLQPDVRRHHRLLAARQRADSLDLPRARHGAVLLGRPPIPHRRLVGAEGPQARHDAPHRPRDHRGVLRVARRDARPARPPASTSGGSSRS